VASSIPKVDLSVAWPICTRCRRKHMPGSVCPPLGVWIVLTLCHRCDPKTGAYCGRHGGRIGPVVDGDPRHEPPPLVADVRQRAAGDREAD
jgi:hypothetical protein